MKEIRKPGFKNECFNTLKEFMARPTLKLLANAVFPTPLFD